MIICNHKPIKVIGFEQSSMTNEILSHIRVDREAEQISPDDFLNLSDKNQFQYILVLSMYLGERKILADVLDQQNLDLVTVIHDSVVLGANPAPSIGKGSVIFPFCNIKMSSSVGRHCIIGDHSMIGHYCSVGDGSILRPGVFLLDRSHIGRYCIIGAQSTILNQITIVDNVQTLPLSKITKNVSASGLHQRLR